MKTNLEGRIWWDYIEDDIKELLKQSLLLVDIFSQKARFGDEDVKFHDWSFIVFPAAKAYEGFLKTLFLDLGFISRDDYYGKRFRIGMALNPHLEKYLREKISVYDKLVDFCQGKDLPDTLWDTWKAGRNVIFHWFPDEKNAIDYDEARLLVTKILNAMDLAFKECKIERRDSHA